MKILLSTLLAATSLLSGLLSIPAIAAPISIDCSEDFISGTAFLKAKETSEGWEFRVRSRLNPSTEQTTSVLTNALGLNIPVNEAQPELRFTFSKNQCKHKMNNTLVILCEAHNNPRLDIYSNDEHLQSIVLKRIYLNSQEEVRSSMFSDGFRTFYSVHPSISVTGKNNEYGYTNLEIQATTCIKPKSTTPQ